MKKNWKNTLVLSSTPIIEAIKTLDAAAMQILLVIDANGRLLGSVSDGDIRRGLLASKSLQEPISAVMNANPVVASQKDTREIILEKMTTANIRHVPVLNDQRQIIRLETLERINRKDELENWVVLMAGGQGNRLRPLTEDTPKPLLTVGERPILETILSSFASQGFRNFFISVNYKAGMIEDCFGDGSKWGVNIQYLRETKPLGTAGALSLLPAKPDKPLIVMNGDLLTKVNFRHLLDFHEQQGAQATVCARDYEFQLPYGVLNIQNDQLSGFDEKPVQHFFVNAGIYAISPESLGEIPNDTFSDMPGLLTKVLEKQKRVVPFLIHEYWLDIGRIADLERANIEFNKIFG